MTDLQEGLQVQDEAPDASLEARMQTLIGPFLAERDQLHAKLMDLRQAEDAVKQDIAKLDRVLKAAGLTTRAAKPKVERAPRASGLGAKTLETIEYVVHLGLPVTTLDVKHGLGLTATTGVIKKRLDQGRDAGVLRLSGQKRRTDGRGGRLLAVYAAMPDAAERLAELRAG